QTSLSILSPGDAKPRPQVPQTTGWPCPTARVAMTLCSAGLPPVLRKTCGLSSASTARLRAFLRPLQSWREIGLVRCETPKCLHLAQHGCAPPAGRRVLPKHETDERTSGGRRNPCGPGERRPAPSGRDAAQTAS